jgi:hypothetical protein
MLVDAGPIRNKARQEYQKVLRELENARAQIEEFEKRDRPEFARWISRHCGALLTEIRETEQKLRSARDLLFQVEAEALFGDCSHPRAYERVMGRNRQEQERQATRATDDTEPGTGGGEARGQGDFRGPFEEDFFFHADPGARTESAAPKNPARSARLKELYRALVRRLHPDTRSSSNARHMEWWHQVQVAYESGDIEQLEVLLTLCEVEEKKSATSVSLLMRMTRHLRSSLRTLNSQLRAYRRDPAWRFRARKDPAALLGEIEWKLKAELSEAKQVLAALEAQLESWARQARSGRRIKRPRRHWPEPLDTPF